MLKHVVLIKLKENYNSESFETVFRQMDGLPDQIPSIVTLSHGRNAGVTDEQYDYGIVVEFANREDYLSYLSHPAHRALGNELNQLIGGAAQIQFEY